MCILYQLTLGLIKKTLDGHVVHLDSLFSQKIYILQIDTEMLSNYLTKLIILLISNEYVLTQNTAVITFHSRRISTEISSFQEQI